MSERWDGRTERRGESMSVQRDLGRIDNELANLARRVTDHIAETEKHHKIVEDKLERRRIEVDSKLDEILGAVQASQAAISETRGGWKMLGKIGAGGAIGGGTIAALLEWLGSGMKP